MGRRRRGRKQKNTQNDWENPSEASDKYQFQKKEYILCKPNGHGQLYRAKVLKHTIYTNPSTHLEEVRYYVHYHGWSQQYNEWVLSDRCFKITPSNIEKQKQMKHKVPRRSTDSSPATGGDPNTQVQSNVSVPNNNVTATVFGNSVSNHPNVPVIVITNPPANANTTPVTTSTSSSINSQQQQLNNSSNHTHIHSMGCTNNDNIFNNIQSFNNKLVVPNVNNNKHVTNNKRSLESYEQILPKKRKLNTVIKLEPELSEKYKVKYEYNNNNNNNQRDENKLEQIINKCDEDDDIKVLNDNINDGIIRILQDDINISCCPKCGVSVTRTDKDIENRCNLMTCKEIGCGDNSNYTYWCWDCRSIIHLEVVDKDNYEPAGACLNCRKKSRQKRNKCQTVNYKDLQ